MSDRWPTAGQTEINWDLSVPGRKHTIDLPGTWVLQPADCEQIDLSSLVLGKASFADFEPLINSFFRLTDSSLWTRLEPRKLGMAILHIAKGWPISPVLLSLHEDGGFHFGGGSHRYQVLKRSGSLIFTFWLSQMMFRPLISNLRFSGCATINYPEKQESQ